MRACREGETLEVDETIYSATDSHPQEDRFYEIELETVRLRCSTRRLEHPEMHKHTAHIRHSIALRSNRRLRPVLCTAAPECCVQQLLSPSDSN